VTSYTVGMDSLSDLLGNKSFDEPPEIKLIKVYAQTEFHSVVEVMVRDKDIIITAPSAALANTLRLRGPEIKLLCQTDKRLVFRIG